MIHGGGNKSGIWVRGFAKEGTQLVVSFTGYGILGVENEIDAKEEVDGTSSIDMIMHTRLDTIK